MEAAVIWMIQPPHPQCIGTRKPCANCTRCETEYKPDTDFHELKSYNFRGLPVKVK